MTEGNRNNGVKNKCRRGENPTRYVLFKNKFKVHVVVEWRGCHHNPAKKVSVTARQVRLVPAQDVHFFYTRSHLSALQNCAFIFSTNF